MRRFLFHILIASIFACTILLSFTWYNAHWIREADFKLSKSTHIIAIGPSTTGCALNEKHIAGFLNMSRNGTGFSLFIPLLPRILQDNPQIDTVLINHGRFLFKQEPGKQENRIMAMRDQVPIMFYDLALTEWNNLLSNSTFYCALLNPDIIQMFISDTPKHIKDFGFQYSELERNNLKEQHKKWSVAWYDSIASTGNSYKYSGKWIKENCSTNDQLIRKVITICKNNNVVPVLFFTPVYHYERWYPIKGFCDYMKDYDDNTLIADYEDFVFPDDSYYGDVHHLNSKGADYFTSYIAKHGLNVKTLKEWLKEKGY
mgnify:CR=1 FL=1